MRPGVFDLVPYKNDSPKYVINMLQKLFCSNRSELVLYFKHSWSEISKKGEIFATDLYGGTSSEFANMLSHSGLVQFINYSVNGNIWAGAR